jgi:hypothetical protein
VTSMNSVEFCKKPTYSEKSARLKFGVFQQNRPITALQITANLRFTSKSEEDISIQSVS